MLNSGIGLYGGSFAPVHNGHVRGAIEALEQLDLAEVRMIPTGQPAHRGPAGVDGERRLRWLAAALDGDPRLIADDDELRHDGRSYTVRTLERFRARHPDRPLVWLLGTDSFNDLHTWHEWPRLFELAHLAVLRRPGHRPAPAPEVAAHPEFRASELCRRLAGGWVCVDMPELDISSSSIRKRIADGRSLRGLLPDAVMRQLDADDLADLAES